VGAESDAGARSAPAAAAPSVRGVLPWVALAGAAGVTASGLVSRTVHALVGVGATAGGQVGRAQLRALATVNLLGSFALGLLWGRAARPGARWDPRVVPAVGTGFLGAFTSFGGALAVPALPLGQAAWGMASDGAGLWVLPALLGLLLLAGLLVLAVASTAAAGLGLRLGRGARPSHPSDAEAAA